MGLIAIAGYLRRKRAQGHAGNYHAQRKGTIDGSTVGARLLSYLSLHAHPIVKLEIGCIGTTPHNSHQASRSGCYN